jgi:hypothetical protein
MNREIDLIAMRPQRALEVARPAQGVIERLRRFAEADATRAPERAVRENDAVRVDISDSARARIAAARSEAARIETARSEANRSERRPEGVEGDLEGRVRPQRPAASEPFPFSDKGSVVGRYGDGTFSIGDMQGSYYAAGDKMGFTIGNYKGLVGANNQGIMMDQTTGELSKVTARFEDGKFALEVEKLAAKPFSPTGKEPFFTEIAGGPVQFHLGANGEVSAQAQLPNGSTVNAKGYMDGKGNMVLTADNGAMYRLNYSMGRDGSLSVYRPGLM